MSSLVQPFAQQTHCTFASAHTHTACDYVGQSAIVERNIAILATQAITMHGFTFCVR